MTTRLRQLGGLYVYMDGIRVQPYGRPDKDYLEIEERRTLGAGYYYFSYRRMFGAVSLSTERNAALKEKAGREGFTQGRAYSDFRGRLINLFEELAATFFRATSPQVEAYEKGRERLKREHALREERDKRARAGRRRLRSQLAIRGSDISRYLDELFRDRLVDVGVEIRPSREFQAARLEGYTSTFYPVFINLVDNSLYWIQRDSAESTQVIELDTSGDALVYRDSGPGIAEDIAERVFDFGFTTKPGGSGLGLAIASQVLERAGWSIRLGDPDDGTEFLIRPKATGA